MKDGRQTGRRGRRGTGDQNIIVAVMGRRDYREGGTENEEGNILKDGEGRTWKVKRLHSRPKWIKSRRDG